MNFYTFVFKHPQHEDKPWNYNTWFGLEKNLKVARKKAVRFFPGQKIVTWSWCKWWQLIYMFSFFTRYNINLNEKK